MMSVARRFIHDQSGAVATLTGVALIALVGIGGLAYDVSRALALRAELESAVDAAALAGASQLDGTPGAMGRAQSAAMGSLVSNREALADAFEANVAIVPADIAFLSAREPDVVATTDASASFIRIDLTPRSLGLVFGVLTDASGFNATAHAVAGYGTAICKVPPLLICNPTEGGGNLTFDGNAHIGKALLLTPQPGGNNPWPPGNYGFLSVGAGANAIKDAMGRNTPLTECFGTTVQPQPGNIASADDWINVRFDIYRSSTSGLSNDPNYVPAMNAIIGKQSSNLCNPAPDPPINSCADATAVAGGMALPPDCNQTGSTPLGSGTWNVQKYFATNHGGIGNPTTYTPETPTGATGSGWDAFGPTPAAGVTAPTRFQVYNWELAMLSGSISIPAGAFSQSQLATSGVHDFARPRCNTTGAQQSPDRRTISAVVANCQADGLNGASNPAHAIAYVDLFLTSPAVSNVLYGEVIGATTNVSAVGAETMLYSVRLYE
jgi:hypothetical protein